MEPRTGESDVVRVSAFLGFEVGVNFWKPAPTLAALWIAGGQRDRRHPNHEPATRPVAG